MSEYTYDEYLKKWNLRFGESQSAEVYYSSHGVILLITINRLSPEAFEHAKDKLRELREVFDYYSEEGNSETAEKTLQQMSPYELVLLI